MATCGQVSPHAGTLARSFGTRETKAKSDQNARPSVAARPDRGPASGQTRSRPLRHAEAQEHREIVSTEQATLQSRLPPKGDTMAVQAASADSSGKVRGLARAAVRFLAAAMVMALMSACEHGPLAYDTSTGAFVMPFGSGSRTIGSNH
jgi:hypothetical protein